MGRNKLKIFYISAGRSDYGLIKNGIIQFQKIKKIEKKMGEIVDRDEKTHREV